MLRRWYQTSIENASEDFGDQRLETWFLCAEQVDGLLATLGELGFLVQLQFELVSRFQ